MHVKTPTQETKIRSLSGGNQQKVILGRWLLTDPTVLLLDEPTRGIDVGAKYEIYQLIIDLAAKGKTVIMGIFGNARTARRMRQNTRNVGRRLAGRGRRRNSHPRGYYDSCGKICIGGMKNVNSCY